MDYDNNSTIEESFSDISLDSQGRNCISDNLWGVLNDNCVSEDLSCSRVTTDFDTQEQTISSISLSDTFETSQRTEDYDDTSCSSSFKELPSLNSAYKRVRLENKRYQTMCRFCNKTIRSQETDRLVKHLRECPFKERIIVDAIIKQQLTRVRPLDDDKNRMLNLKWALLIAESNISLNILESKRLKDFFKELCPGFNLDSRSRYMNQYIPLISSKVTNDWLNDVKQKQLITVEFDHWNDSTRRQLLGVTTTLASGQRYICELVDVSEESQTAGAIATRLVNIIMPFRSKINDINQLLL